MKFITTIVTLALSYASLASASPCFTGGVAGVGDSVKTFPTDYQFILFGRNSSNFLLGVNTTNTGDYAPLTLEDASASLFGFPQFELINGQLRTYNKPYRYVTTKGNPLVQEMQLFTSPEGVGMPVSVVADNVTCDAVSRYAIRFQGLVPLATGSGATNGTFQKGATLTSPILTQALPLTLMKPLDLILTFF